MLPAMWFLIAGFPSFGRFQLEMLMRVWSNKKVACGHVEIDAKLRSHRPSFIGLTEGGA